MVCNLTTPPDSLTDDEQIGLKQVLASCPHLEATAGHVASFAEMLTERLGEQLNSWMSAVSADDLPHLYRFVRGLDTDHAAVRNGLTLQFRCCRRACQSDQDAQTANVRTCWIRLASQTNTPQRLTLSKSITESGPEPLFNRRQQYLSRSEKKRETIQFLAQMMRLPSRSRPVHGPAMRIVIICTRRC